ncbi:MAG TPA: VWA domain-containing protein [Moraxellaceae bacterium]|nr:VWA domain-containing protein [Moraxellaceae bacterium]
MDLKLAEFVGILRHNGVRIASPEVADAARAIALVGYGDRLQFRDALRATLAKSEPEQHILDTCFDAFFRVDPVVTDREPPSSGAPDSGMAISPAQGGQGQGGAQGHGAQGQGGGPPIPGVPSSPLADALLAGDSTALTLLMAQASAASGQDRIRVLTQKGLFARRLLLAMGVDSLDRELAALDANGTAAAVRRASLLRERLTALRQQVRTAVERNFRLRRDRSDDAALRETDLALLRESDETRAVVRRLARKLIVRHQRRERLALRGRLDVKATLRRNVAHDGALIDPRWRRIRKDRPRIIAVCDVSRSVSQYSRFLLLFLYSLQKVIPRLRTFVFTSPLHEVTALFEREDIDDALDTVMDRYGLGSSDYGRALADFERLALRDIDTRTTVLVLGDARNNRGDARLDLLQKVRRRARQLIWLNPEDRSRWGSGDSEMLRYLTACSHAYACRSLGELEHIVDRLLRTG